MERIIRLSEAHYYFFGATLSPGVRISSTYRIIEGDTDEDEQGPRDGAGGRGDG